MLIGCFLSDLLLCQRQRHFVQQGCPDRVLLGGVGVFLPAQPYLKEMFCSTQRTSSASPSVITRYSSAAIEYVPKKLNVDAE